MQLNKAVALLCIVSLLTGCGQTVKPVPELLEPVSAQKEYGLVRQGDLAEKVYYNAYVYPQQTYISPQIDSKIKTVSKAIGETVKKGDPLVIMDTEDIDRQIKLYTQKLDALNALFTLEKKVSDMEIQIAQTGMQVSGQEYANLQEQISKLKSAMKKQKKNKTLSNNTIAENKEKIESFQQQQAMLQEEMNDHRHEAASEAISQSLDSEIHEIDKKECEDRLQQLRKQKNQNEIVSPCDGIITYNNLIASAYTAELFHDSRYLNADMPFMIIADENEKYISVPGLSEKKFDPATMSAYAVINGTEYPLTKYPYDAETQKLCQKLEMQYYQDYIDLDIRFTCEEAILDSLSAGDFVNVYFVEKQKNNVLSAPNDTIYRTPDETYVIRVVNGKEQKTVVETGMRTSHETEIISGVKKGDILLSKNVFFEVNSINEKELTACDFDWEEEYKSFFLAPLYIKYVYSGAAEGRLQEICVNEGDVVKKGDILAKIKLYSNQSKITALDYQLTTLQQDKDNEISQLNKQQTQMIGRLYELQDQNPNDYMIPVLKLQIAYFDLLKQQTETGFDINRVEVQEQLRQLKEDNSEAIIKAECDGIAKNIQKKSVGKMVTSDTLLMQIIPQETYAVGISDRKTLVYNMPVRLHVKGAGDNEYLTATVCRAPNVSLPWDSAYFHFAYLNYYEYVLSVPNEETLSLFYDLDKATAVTRRYANSYQITPKMCFEDDYGTYVYLKKDDKRIKQYVNITEFHNGYAVVLDGISEDSIILEREKE